jgi:hypothetical protein
LADYAGRSKYANEGERVVAGQHLIQAVSDIFLGWNRSRGADGFLVRPPEEWPIIILRG